VNDRGFATIWTAWVVAALAALVALLMGLAAVVVARHRAESAADLSALAAAAYGPWGEEYACGLARWVSDRMGVRLADCHLSGWVVRVEVVAAVNGLGDVTARARAGPAGHESGRRNPPARHGQRSSKSGERRHSQAEAPR